MYACIHLPGASGAAARRLAALAQAFSPKVEVTAPDTVVLDIAPLRRLFGAPDNPTSQVVPQSLAELMLERTAANMVYVGEWHSHPRSNPTLPSSDDLKVLASVAEWVNPAGQPGLIMIAGDDGHARVLIEGFDSENPTEETCPA